MGVDEEKSEGKGKVWSLCRMPFWQTSSGNDNGNGSSSSSSSSMGNNNVYQQSQSSQLGERSTVISSNAVSSIAKSLLPTRRRLKLDPSNKLYFPCKNLLLFFSSL